MCDSNLDPANELEELADDASKLISRQQRVPSENAGARFDSIAAELFPEFSRSRLQAWIKSAELTVEGRALKANTKLAGGELLSLQARLQPEGEWLAEAIDFQVVHEDESILVVNKPAGLVVHPAVGNTRGTLLNGLIYTNPALREIPRAGIVHRLDKETSGLMVVAKTLQAQNSLVEQLQARTVKRVYEALVQGRPNESGRVEANIGRHPNNRLKMAVVAAGKPAVTHYSLLSSNNHFSHLRIKLETGRTHQIRVHMAHIGFPLVGDQVYGRGFNKQQLRLFPGFELAAHFPRQALHAVALGLIHPETGLECLWRVSLTDDIAKLKRELLTDEDAFSSGFHRA